MNFTEIINGIKYVKIRYTIMERTNTDKLTKYCSDNDIILQSMDIIRKGGYFSNPIVGANLLIPENKVLEFNNTKFSRY